MSMDLQNNQEDYMKALCDVFGVGNVKLYTEREIYNNSDLYDSFGIDHLKKHCPNSGNYYDCDMFIAEVKDCDLNLRHSIRFDIKEISKESLIDCFSGIRADAAHQSNSRK